MARPLYPSIQTSGEGFSNESGALSFVCSCQPSLQLAGRRGAPYGPSSGSASKWKIRTWFPRWQDRRISLAVGVRSAEPIFVTAIIHFQVVGHLLAAFAVTQHGRVQRMVKLERFHA